MAGFRSLMPLSLASRFSGGGGGMGGIPPHLQALLGAGGVSSPKIRGAEVQPTGGSGLAAATTSPGSPSPVGVPSVPGVSGVTPGAIERRLSPPATMQALQGTMGGGQSTGPPRSMFTNVPNLLGPARSQVRTPMALVQQALRQQQRR